VITRLSSPRSNRWTANWGSDCHTTVRRDRVDDAGSVTLRHAGRLHHIGVGRTRARTPIILLVYDLQIRIVDATTGELLRELTLNPDTDTPTPTTSPRQQETPDPQAHPQVQRFPMSREITSVPPGDSNLRIDRRRPA
jgi:hypothetical protein